MTHSLVGPLHDPPPLDAGQYDDRLFTVPLPPPPPAAPPPYPDHLALMTLIGLAMALYLIGQMGALSLTSLRRVMIRADRSGWWAFVPFANKVVLLRIGGQNVTWIGLAGPPLITLGFLIVDPAVMLSSSFLLVEAVAAACSVVLSMIIGSGVAARFGRTRWFGMFGLGLVPVVCYPMVAFGQTDYQATS